MLVAGFVVTPMSVPPTAKPVNAVAAPTTPARTGSGSARADAGASKRTAVKTRGTHLCMGRGGARNSTRQGVPKGDLGKVGAKKARLRTGGEHTTLRRVRLQVSSRKYP